MIRLLIYILFAMILNISMQARTNHISGKFNPELGIFETTDRTYWIGLFDGNYARISKNGLMGLIDKSGKIILEPKYDRIIDIDSMFIRVALNGRFISIERAEEKKFNPDYYVEQFHEGIARFTIDGETFGFINKQGMIIMEPSKIGRSFSNFIGGYSMLSTFREWIVVDTNGRQTTIRHLDTHGNILRRNTISIPRTQGFFVIPKRIDGQQKFYYLDNKLRRLSDLYFSVARNFVNGYAVVNYRGTWGILNTKGELLKTDYSGITAVENGTFIVSKRFSERERDIRVGVINAQGDILIPLKYAGIRYLFDDLYKVSTGSFGDFPTTRMGNSQYVLDINNRKLLPRRFYRIERFNNLIAAFDITGSENLDAGLILSRFHVWRYMGYVYFFNKEGHLVNENGIYIEFDSQCAFSMRMAIDNALITGKYYIRRVGNEVQLLRFEQYDVLIPIPDEKFIVAKNDSNNQFKYELIDIDGNFLEAFECREVRESVFHALFRRGLINWDGSFLHSLEYVVVRETVLNYISSVIEEHTRKYGLIDINGEFLVPLEYDKIRESVFNRLSARKGGKWGVINYSNEVVVPLIYESLINAETGFIAVKNGKFGFIDLMGKEIIPFVYDYMSENRHRGFFNAEINGKRVRINRKGIKLTTE